MFGKYGGNTAPPLMKGISARERGLWKDGDEAPSIVYGVGAGETLEYGVVLFLSIFPSSFLILILCSTTKSRIFYFNFMPQLTWSPDHVSVVVFGMGPFPGL